MTTSQHHISSFFIFTDIIIYHHYFCRFHKRYINIFSIFKKHVLGASKSSETIFQSSKRLFLGAVYWQWVQIDKRFQRRHMRLGMLVYMGSRFGISYSMLIETKRRHMCLRMLVYIGSRFGIGYCNSDSRCLSKVSKGKGCKCNMCAPTPTHPPTLRI